MRLTLLFLLLSLHFASVAQTVNLIPQPVSLQLKGGQFTLSRQTVITAADEEDRKAARFLNDYLQQVYGFRLDVDRQEGRNYVRLVTRKFIQAPQTDAYQLNVTADGVTIEGDTYAGTFYGLQTLIQLLPVHEGTAGDRLAVPFVTVQDRPRFAYRGLHLDVARHFYPVAFLKKYIDYIALHKMNYFHWHLTDDQGWRIEIKKYPRLTEVGAWRNGTIIGRYPGTGNDNLRYGGFYTQDEVKEVVQYAADRHITVVPEIEMPGHASAAIAAYPWLSCFPEQKTRIPGPASAASQQADGKLVQETWGVFDDVFCAGRDSTFRFLQDVLDEVVPLFPSRFIHVGGDESPKVHWKKCPRCQQRIRDEGLKDEHELQSYFIQRMEKHLNAKGKTIIGWDEILEGGLAPNAVVMSWRGEAGGIEAAKQKHQVIMTPGSHVYFDHTQSGDEDSVTFGGYSPLDKVYSYEPVPKELTAEQGRYILGAQANLWTEYIKNTRKVEYMLFPRISALSEVLWSPKEKRNWDDFEKRLPVQLLRYDRMGINYSRAYYDIKGSILPAPANNGLLLKLETKDRSAKLTYGIREKFFQKDYTAPVVLRESGEVTGVYMRNNRIVDSVSFRLQFHKATGKKVTLKDKPSRNYPGDGAFTLVNGIRNTRGLGRAREFIGFEGKDLEATIDLGRAQRIDSVVVHSLVQEGSWIYAPSAVDVSGSADGRQYSKLGTTTAFVPTAGSNGYLLVTFVPASVRYLRVTVRNNGPIPDGKPGAGHKAWLFSDEIEVN